MALLSLAKSKSDCFLYGTEFQFHTLNVLVDISSAQSCAEACHESDSCNFATYYEDRAVCHLKSESLPVSRKHATSVAMQCLYPTESFKVANHTDLGSLDRSPTDIIMKDVCFQMDILYSGGDMSNRHAKDKETCVVYCYMRDGCTVMSFETASHLCYFKNGGERTPLVGTISASIECFPSNTSTTTSTTTTTTTTPENNITLTGTITTITSAVTSLEGTTTALTATASVVGELSTRTSISMWTTTAPTTTSHTTTTPAASTLDPVVIIIDSGGIVVDEEEDDIAVGADADEGDDDDGEDDDQRFPQTTQDRPW
ncbi:MAG: hypothetical protein KVP17_000203 [Porospora cf. gigantea B]|uniref:uncharacterized protein n=1 Tax=Porospora cf. gigantea B TaxID=2853592 RepID=UPI0035718245|nr:MAG: hypothetical protein KVP17_000203 [Porospora cf. gigantea B]